MFLPEMHTLEAATAFCGKSRCLTHMAALCSTPASFTLIFLSFAPLLTSSNHHPSLCHHHNSCRLWPHSSFVPSLPFCFAACLPLPSFPHTLQPPSLPQLFFNLYLSVHWVPFTLYYLLYPPHLPPRALATLHPDTCSLPASLHPALPACLSTGKPCFLSLSSLPELI